MLDMIGACMVGVPLLLILCKKLRRRPRRPKRLSQFVLAIRFRSFLMILTTTANP